MATVQNSAIVVDGPAMVLSHVYEIRDSLGNALRESTLCAVCGSMIVSRDGHFSRGDTSITAVLSKYRCWSGMPARIEMSRICVLAK